MNKFITVAIVLVVLGAIGWGVRGLFNLPGEVVADLGRDHWEPEKLADFKYSSNPPTSGPHDPNWIRPGEYDVPQDKYKLIHSLEHGYVAIHYNCDILVSSDKYSVFSVSAHEDEGDLDNDEPTTPSGTLSEKWQTQSCQDLKNTLSKFKEKIGLQRIIINPNPELDDRIVIVAWNRIIKMNDWNEAEAARFAKAFHNRGPEQTME